MLDADNLIIPFRFMNSKELLFFEDLWHCFITAFLQ